MNRGIRVLQTHALPLGYVTILKKTRGCVFFFWSGRRGSNSLPPPWQGGALPDELRPRTERLRLYHKEAKCQAPILKVLFPLPKRSASCRTFESFGSRNFPIPAIFQSGSLPYPTLSLYSALYDDHIQKRTDTDT